MSMGRAVISFLVSTVILVASVASARPHSTSERNTQRRVERVRYRGPGARVIPRRSRSVGLPFRGRLQRGVEAVPTPYLRYTAEYAPGGNFYGTWELVQLLERAAYRVWQRAPGSKLSIGELSDADGGRLAGHNSHQNGRDADIAFYMLDGRGEAVVPYAFAAFDGDGDGRGPNRGLRFDDRRNFELVAKLVTDGDARVQYIFVSAPIKRRLLAWGRRHRARSVIMDRLEKVLVQPSGRHPHDNHFHIRIYCAPADRPACRDEGPLHAWYPGPLPAAGVALRK
jgi:penicillin-insensitive murein endopeptidase